MEVIRIEDPDDPRFRQFRLNERGLASRADKRDDAGAGMFLAEGDLVVERALAAGCRPVAALVDIERIPDVAHGTPLPCLRRRRRPSAASCRSSVCRCRSSPSSIDRPARASPISPRHLAGS